MHTHVIPTRAGVNVGFFPPGRSRRTGQAGANRTSRTLLQGVGEKPKIAELARQKSIGPSRARGGDLGFFAKGAMVKPFSDAAFALKPGEITQKPVKTQFGWHIIKLEERRSGSVPSFAKSRAKLSSEMTQRVITEAVESLRKGAKIETFGLNGRAQAPTRIRRVQ